MIGNRESAIEIGKLLRWLVGPSGPSRVAGLNAQGYADVTDETDRADQSRRGGLIAQRA